MVRRQLNSVQLKAVSEAKASELLRARETPRTEEDYLKLAAALERDIDAGIAKEALDLRTWREVVAELRRRAWRLPPGDAA